MQCVKIFKLEGFTHINHIKEGRMLYFINGVANKMITHTTQQFDYNRSKRFNTKTNIRTKLKGLHSIVVHARGLIKIRKYCTIQYNIIQYNTVPVLT